MGLVDANRLRREMSERNRAYARETQTAHLESYGGSPVVMYPPDGERGEHGNFFPASYKAILQEPNWNKRFRKAHTHGRHLPRSEHGAWCELDSCNSSDALLMNIFCHPAVTRSGMMQALLMVETGERPVFGTRARVPLAGGLSDATEIDMRWGDLLVEAKLTESDFQRKPARLVERYRDLETVFAVEQLPRREGEFLSYQLIRNVLAAFAQQRRFCLLTDERRPDLKEEWHRIQRAVRDVAFRTRLLMLTWQEVAAAAPAGLQRFLKAKYGIAA